MIIPNSVAELATYVEKGRNVFFFTADWCGEGVGQVDFVVAQMR